MHDTAAAVAGRHGVVMQAVTARVAGFLTDGLAAAFILDPYFCQQRNVVARGGRGPENYDIEAAWAQARPRAKQWLEKQLKKNVGLVLDLQREFDNYCLQKEAFATEDYMLPPEGNVRTHLRDWWLKAPGRLLPRMALKAHCLRQCSTLAETGWATVGRQLTPIRNRLEPATLEMIMEVDVNLHLFFPELQQRSRRSTRVIGERVTLAATMGLVPVVHLNDDEDESESQSSADLSSSTTDEGNPSSTDGESQSQ